ncbi:MAG TPA: 4-alpha-glucanotransferase [Steroidobacteraceae bacterium]|jgi:4-alpha-glucanotransferase|nr:4-alpha-glucanotransferase [Steroidobacteraceae bacterium]
MTERVLDRRRSGVLLHPTSLISVERGALGGAARGLIDWLAQAGFTIWQILPLGPPGDGGSPYWARSDFAGHLALLDRGELPSTQAQRADYDAFREASRDWLDDYVLFEQLAQQFRRPWWEWPPELRSREPAALARIGRDRGRELEQRRIDQWYFDWQWRALRRYAQERGVRLFGDLPIYVAPDSVSTWSQPHQFKLQPDGRPAVLAGVPPDYFSADGQLWGNPLYDWQRAQQDQFAFWRARLARQLRRFDLVRIDHFRGLAAYWAVPAGARTAREGRWEPAPGEALFKALQADHPELPLVAEDLGLITADVEALRRAFGLPGMRVLQFGFDGSGTNPHLPHNYSADVVAYAGTHDNDTTLGWYRSLSAQERARVDFYLYSDAGHVLESMLRATLSSVAQLAILSAQDLLQLGSEARFNTPGTAQGNWSWRLPPGALTAPLAAHYAALNQTFGRVSAADWPAASG